MAPEDPGYQYQLGIALYRSKQLQPALEALDSSLRLKPNDPNVLSARASVRFRAGNETGARADADAVDQLLSPNSDLRRGLAATYIELHLYSSAINQLDEWLASHPKDQGVAGSLNNRCWARALWNHDLPLAVADCNAALKLSPNSAVILNSRGLARLRLGDNAGALADYDASLRVDPSRAWSLFGRGLAKEALGRIDDGKADINAAIALDPSVASAAAAAGLAH